jgi:hypothetical protein
VRSLPATAPGSSLDPALLHNIRKPLLADLAPVKPLPGTAVLALAFCLLFAAVIALASYFLRFAGWRALSFVERSAVFGFLLILIVASAVALASRMRPGALPMLPGWALPIIAFASFELLFLLLLQDYRLGHFMRSGLGCLKAGLLCALPAALVAPLLLLRGYVVTPVSTGAALGVGAGLVGLTVIEFHCPIETLPHVAVWHMAIVAVSTAVGALSGLVSSKLSHRIS